MEPGDMKKLVAFGGRSHPFLCAHGAQKSDHENGVGYITGLSR